MCDRPGPEGGWFGGIADSMLGFGAGDAVVMRAWVIALLVRVAAGTGISTWLANKRTEACLHAGHRGVGWEGSLLRALVMWCGALGSGG